MKDVISAAGAPAPAGPYSPGLVVGDWILLSGQGGFDPRTGQLVSDDIAGQTAQVFRNIEALLYSAGADLDDVVSCLVHISDLALFDEFNADYERHFPRARQARAHHGPGRPGGRHARRGDGHRRPAPPVTRMPRKLPARRTIEEGTEVVVPGGHSKEHFRRYLPAWFDKDLNHLLVVLPGSGVSDLPKAKY